MNTALTRLNFTSKNNFYTTSRKTGKLADSLSSEQQEKLTHVLVENSGGIDDSSDTLPAKPSTRKQFKLKAIIHEIDQFEESGFPLPTHLEEEHWQDLIELENREIRTYYLDALASGLLNKEKKVELYKQDQVLSGPLILPQNKVDEITAEGDPWKIQRLDEIKYVYESIWQTGQKLYPILAEIELTALMETDSRVAISRAFHFSRTKHNAQIVEYVNKRIKQAKASVLIEQYHEELKANTHIFYGLGQNTIYYRINKQAMEKPDKNKTIREFNEWGQPLVLDLSFVKRMSFQQVKSLFYRELNFAIKANEESREPFAIYLTSYDPNCSRCAVLSKGVNNIMKEDFPVVVTEKSYLELFPKERLLYLSPDSKNDLMEHDPNNIYVIGGIIDTTGGGGTQHVPYTLSEAKKQNIRHARLPMKRVLGLHRELNVDTCVAIMADFKFTNDWFYSFRWVPARVYKNRLKNPQGATTQMEAVFIAHRDLSPNGSFKKREYDTDGSFTENEGMNELALHELVNMSPKEYRRRYKEIMENFLKNPQANSKLLGQDVIDAYKWKQKEIHYEKKYRTTYDTHMRTRQ